MVVGVLVEITNKNVDKLFYYQVNKILQSQIKVGVRVVVPFAHTTLEGFVLAINPTEQYGHQLKEIIEVIDAEVVLNDELLALGKQLAKETLASRMSCYQVMLPKALKAKARSIVRKKYQKVYYYHPEVKCLLTPKQQEIIDCFQEGRFLTRSSLQEFSSARLKVLVNKGILEERERECYRLHYDTQTTEKHPLTKEQQQAVETIFTTSKTVSLLHGVTGSGKTEVYMELIERALKQGKQSIVLVPEISLTPQMVNRFQSRFGDQIAALHSALSEGEKYDEWRRISRGEVTIVIGARSAIFAPLTNVGFIIIDEEHSDSYKQENTPRYHATQIALIRAKFHQAKIVLGSATPTLESYARAKKGVYQLVTLPHRVNGKSLPMVEVVDMNEAIKTAKGHFSLPLLQAIKRCLEKKEQCILLLNRRGYASFVSCRQCGYVRKCPHCDITLTFHKHSNTLRCHYCGYGTNTSLVCPNCHEEAMQDLGVGTERIEEELTKLFQGVKIIRMDVDTTSRKGSHQKMITAFANHEAQILLGTQLVAKGLDFEDVTLVGVINADTSLMLPDFRAAEMTFSLLNQVSGRSGRSAKEGHVIFQTYNPDNYAIVCAKNNDYQRFYQEEMAIRHLMKYPPYYYLISIHIASKEANRALLEAKRCEKVVSKYLTNTILLGPSPASIFKKNNIYRYQLILKYQHQDQLQETLQKLVDYYAPNHKVKLEIDFSPLHL